MDVFYSYLQFPTAVDINNEEEGEELLKNLSLIIDRADCENGSMLLYEQSNKESFYEELDTYHEMIPFFGTFSFQDAVNLLLNEASAKNWEEGPLFINDKWVCRYRLEHDDTAAFTDDLPDYLKEVAERTLSIKNEKCVLILMSPIQLGHNPVSIVKKLRDKPAQLCQFDVVLNFDELDRWYEANRTKRSYNVNDHRHIENHPHYIVGKSPLLGGMAGKANAAELLETAIGDQRNSKYLINYDLGYKCYIRFETERDPQNQFHGYHLVVPRTHERDTVEENKISPRLKMILKYKLDR